MGRHIFEATELQSNIGWSQRATSHFGISPFERHMILSHFSAHLQLYRTVVYTARPCVGLPIAGGGERTHRDAVPDGRVNALESSAVRRGVDTHMPAHARSYTGQLKYMLYM